MKNDAQNYVDSRHRTDDLSKVGRHVFEVAGLGKPPYRLKYEIKKAYQAAEGAPVQPAGTCNYCGKGIIYCYGIESADGKKFEVGCDCIRRTNDKALVKAFKNLPEVRARNRAKTVERDQRVKSEWEIMIADEAKAAILTAHTIQAWNGKTESWLTFAIRAYSYCGMAGRMRYLKTAKALLANAAATGAA